MIISLVSRIAGVVTLFISLAGTMIAGEVPRTQVIARVGRFSITAGDLLDSFEFGPAFVRRVSNPLRTHLEFMIDERLLALEADRGHLDTTAFVRTRTAAINEDLTVDQLYAAEVLSTIHLSDAAIDTAVEKSRVQISLRWLFAPERGGAERLARLLQRGASFDSLMASDTTGDGPEGRTLATTLLGLESNTPGFARSIASLRQHQVSAPLRGPDGFYIVRLDRVWRDPLETESGYAHARDNAARTLREARTNEMADQYAGSLMKMAHPVMKAQGFNILRGWLALKGLSHDERLKWKIPSTFMTEAGPRPIADAGEFLREPLVTFGGRTLSVRDYLEWFQLRQFQLKRSSLSAFNASVKQTVWRLVRDRLLSEEAYRRGLDRRVEVRQESAKWEAKLLYLACRAQFQRSIRVPDSLVLNEYRSHRKRYRDADGQPVSFAQVRDELRRDLADRMESTLIFRTLRQLKVSTPVTVEEAAVAALGAGLLPDNRSIDVIVYKPGGTFPRVAFPTIDQRWQTFP